MFRLLKLKASYLSKCFLEIERGDKMSKNNLHPTVTEFKTFINQHPKLIEEIRKGGKSWQEYYEKWVLLGENDSMWEQFKSDKNNKQDSENKYEWFGQLMKLTENIDLERVQNQVNQLSGTVATLQEILGEFQKKEEPSPNRRQFSWFKD